MATAISQANFEAALGEGYDALRKKNWADVAVWYACAEFQNAGLATSSTAGSMAMSRRDRLEGLRVAIEAAEAAVARHSATSRLGRLGTRHSR